MAAGEQEGRQTRFRWGDSLADTDDIAHRPIAQHTMDIDSSGSGGWRFAQCFGDKGEVEDITEGTALPLSTLIPHPPPRTADIISTVEFDSTGNYLATGDKGGRVVLFERNESVSTLPRSLSRLIPPDCRPTPPPCRKKAVNTSSIPNFNHTNRNSTTSSHWKSRKRSTRSNGANAKTPLISSCPPTVRSLPLPIIAPGLAFSRQNNQTLESV